MEELLCQILGNPETVNKIITELGPKALDNAEHIVISGIETSGQVVECLIKDGKIVEHSAKTVQEAVKSAENVAISIVETGGKVCEYLIKDGKIVQQTAETVQLGIKTTGDIAKELIDRGTDTINTAIETTGNVVASSISERYAYKTAKEAEKTERNRDNNMTKQEAIRKTGDVLGMKILVDGKVKTIEWDSLVEMCQAAINTGNPEIGVQMLSQKYSFEIEKEKTKSVRSSEALKEFKNILGQVGDIALAIKPGGAKYAIGKNALTIGEKFVDSFSKKKKSKSEEVDYKKVYELMSNWSEHYPLSQHPELKPMKKLLDKAVKNGNPEVITITIQVLQEGIEDMQNESLMD